MSIDYRTSKYLDSIDAHQDMLSDARDEVRLRLAQFCEVLRRKLFAIMGDLVANPVHMLTAELPLHLVANASGALENIGDTIGLDDLMMHYANEAANPDGDERIEDDVRDIVLEEIEKAFS